MNQKSTNDDLYHRLRSGIARYSAFFPATKTGIEITFLKKLFTPEEAELYLDLSKDLETPETLAARTNRDADETAHMLKVMAEKGLIFPKWTGEKNYYLPAPFAHGILENQLKTIDRELAQIYEDYIWAEKVPEERPPEDADEPLVPLRSIPIKEPVSVDRPIAVYDDVKQIIMRQNRIAVADCFCAVQQQKLETGCKQPLEVCLLLGFYADYYIDLGLGRAITHEEALKVLETAEEAGLVHQIPNSKDPGAICNCCPDCCGGLRVLRMLPTPGELVTSNYFARIDNSRCTVCGICIDRCPMNAFCMNDDSIEFNMKRCIGCGLCINTCPAGALTLKTKPEHEQNEPPFTVKFMRSSRDIESKIK